MKEQSKIHGKFCSGIWVRFCQLHAVLLPNCTHGQQGSLLCRCPNEEQKPLCQPRPACHAAAARARGSARLLSVLEQAHGRRQSLESQRAPGGPLLLTVQERGLAASALHTPGRRCLQPTASLGLCKSLLSSLAPWSRVP